MDGHRSEAELSGIALNSEQSGFDTLPVIEFASERVREFLTVSETAQLFAASKYCATLFPVKSDLLHLPELPFLLVSWFLLNPLETDQNQLRTTSVKAKQVYTAAGNLIGLQLLSNGTTTAKQWIKHYDINRSN